LAIYVHDDANQIDLTGKFDPRLQEFSARSYRLALVGIGEHRAQDALVDATPSHLLRRVVPGSYPVTGSTLVDHRGAAASIASISRFSADSGG